MKHWPPTLRLGGRQLPEEMHFNGGPYIIGGCNDSDMHGDERDNSCKSTSVP